MANIKAGSTYFNDNNDQLLVDVVKAGTATYLLTQDGGEQFARRMTVTVGTLASLISDNGFVLYGVDES
jgi:hypothetical protein